MRNRDSATDSIVGRRFGFADSISRSSGASGPACVAADSRLRATLCRSAMAFLSVPNGGPPSNAAYSVDPSEKTSEAKLVGRPLAASGARYAGVPVYQASGGDRRIARARGRCRSR